MKSILSWFISWNVSSLIYLKSHWHTQVYIDFSMLTSKNFIVLCFSFRSVIPFGLFSCMSKVCVQFVCLFVYIYLFCLWMSRCFSSFYKRDNFCLIVLILLLCQTSVDYIYMDILPGSLLCSIYLFVYSFANATWSWLP